MEHELHDSNIIRVGEDDGDVRGSTTLLEGDAPPTNNDIVSEENDAPRQSFHHHSEDDFCVRGSTTLLEGEAPTANNDIISEENDAPRQSFHHNSEDDFHVRGSTTLLDGEAPTANNDVVSEENDAPRQSFHRHSEDDFRVRGSTTLLEGEAPTANNDIISEENDASRRSFHHHSEDDFRSPTNHRNRSKLKVFIWPIIACSWQLIVLVLLMTFIISTESIPYPIVIKPLATFYVQYPQGAATTITLVGSLLSLISTKAFSEAIRFSIVVSLWRPRSKNMTLYSLCARISVGSEKTLFDFGRGHVHWTIISLVSLLLVTVQTTAWTTILTPREMDVPFQTPFQDVTYTDILAPYFPPGFDPDWTPAWDSGYAAATEGTNMTQYLPLLDQIFNGTTRGTFPVPTGVLSDDWTRIEAIQQGLTADVNCIETPADDPYIQVNTATSDGIHYVFLCCNCTSGRTNTGDFFPPSLAYLNSSLSYLSFAICPISKTDSVITLYLNSGYLPNPLFVVGNQTCTIRPQWVNVSVTYVHGGFVTLEPMPQQLFDLPFNLSIILQSTIYTLEYNFVNSQTVMGNNIVNSIALLAIHLSGREPPDPQYDEFVLKAMAKYIRGVFEYGATISRQIARNTIAAGTPGAENVGLVTFPATTYVQYVVWGQARRYRLIAVISPFAIMIATIAIILASLYRARHLDLDYITSFNPMNTLHIVAACSSGNVHTVPFPDYGKDIGSFGKDVRVKLSEIEAGSGAPGFQFSLE